MDGDGSRWLGDLLATIDSFYDLFYSAVVLQTLVLFEIAIMEDNVPRLRFPR